jgi:Ion channel
MAIIAFYCVLLVVLTTAIHYEVLRLLSLSLPLLRIPSRAKLMFVIFAAFLAHGVQILLYGYAYYFLAHNLDLGTLGGTAQPSFTLCLYFSAETYTSLGFGDIVPVGPLRFLAGVETLNGLLLIGWSASYTYIAMERFWAGTEDNDRPR